MTDLLDLPPGSVVALQVPGSAAYVEVVLALLGRGIVPSPLDPRLTESETAGILADLEPVAHVTDPDEVEHLARRVADQTRRTPLARRGCRDRSGQVLRHGFLPRV